MARTRIIEEPDPFAPGKNALESRKYLGNRVISWKKVPFRAGCPRGPGLKNQPGDELVDLDWFSENRCRPSGSVYLRGRGPESPLTFVRRFALWAEPGRDG